MINGLFSDELINSNVVISSVYMYKVEDVVVGSRVIS